MTTQCIGTDRSHRIGLVCVVISWIAVAVVNPLVKVLNQSKGFSSEELLIIRSVLGIIVALAIPGWKVFRPNMGAILSGFVISLSSVAYYNAIESWKNVNSVAVVIAFIPVVNVAIALLEGRRVSAWVILSMACLIAGVVRALEPWHTPMHMAGLSLSIACVILSGIGFEMWGRAPDSVTVSEKCFWLSVSALIVSSVIIAAGGRHATLASYADPRSALLLAFFAVPVTVYIFTSIVPFSRVGRMDIVKASVLTQGATPATIVGSYFLVGEVMGPGQWLGVGLALFGASILSVQTIRAKPPAS